MKTPRRIFVNAARFITAQSNDTCPAKTARNYEQDCAPVHGLQWCICYFAIPVHSSNPGRISLYAQKSM